jgi:hypothetical protein
MRRIEARCNNARDFGAGLRRVALAMTEQDSYAARTPARNVFTSIDNCSACLDRLEAAVST